MKKRNLNSCAWILLVALSLSCYLYLANEEKYLKTTDPAAISNLESKDPAKEESKSRIVMPDIALVKKILNITKIVLEKK